MQIPCFRSLCPYSTFWQRAAGSILRVLDRWTAGRLEGGMIPEEAISPGEAMPGEGQSFNSEAAAEHTGAVEEDVREQQQRSEPEIALGSEQAQHTSAAEVVEWRDRCAEKERLRIEADRQIEELGIKVARLEAACEQMTTDKEALQQQVNDLNKSLLQLLADELLANGGVSVMVRIRHDDRVTPGEPVLTVPPNGRGTIMAQKLTQHYQGTPKVGRREFTFDHVFDTFASTTQVAERLEHLVVRAASGEDCILLADGQTDSGKSHTMFEAPDAVAPQLARRLFDLLKPMTGSCEVQCGCLEVYMGGLKSLSRSHEPDLGPRLASTDAICDLQNASFTPVRDAKALMKQYNAAREKRKVRETDKNGSSSRGHLICMIRIVRHPTKAVGDDKTNTMFIVDAAGSERHDDSGSVPEAGKEQISITQERSALHGALKNLGNCKYKCEGNVGHSDQPRGGGRNGTDDPSWRNCSGSHFRKAQSWSFSCTSVH